MSCAPESEPPATGALDLDRLVSGESGTIAGPRARVRARFADLLDDAALWCRLVPPRLERTAQVKSHGKVHVLGLYSADLAANMARAAIELEGSRRRVEFALGALDDSTRELAGWAGTLDSSPATLASQTVATGLRGGKFENLNMLLEESSPSDADWILIVDDDVELPRGFLDRLLFLAERFDFQLVQPALRRTSHAAWKVCRRERWSIARLVQLVEIGPLVAIHRSIAADLLPFPALRMGWGLDLHWGGLARQRGWRLGIVDAVPIRHELRKVAATYDRHAALDEMRRFLGDGRPHIDREAALRVLERHRNWR
jgi:hypothetical protein